jgi:hypothetical protein
MWRIQSVFPLFIVCRTFLSTLTLCYTSFLTRSVQLISILLQQYISELYSSFWSAFWSVRVSATQKAMLQM